MTCIDCINYKWCQNRHGCTDYYDEDDVVVDDVENECSGFIDSNLIIKLPCKVGDIIYKICPTSPHIKMGDMCDGEIVTTHCQRCGYKMADCSNIGYQKGADNVIREFTVKSVDWLFARREYFNSVYFLSREEAERALTILKGGAGDE